MGNEKRVETLHAPHGTELEPVGGRVRLSVVGELALWIEGERPKWVARGVDVLERGGQTLFPDFGTFREVAGWRHIYIGTVESCAGPTEEEFVHLVVLGDGMSVEHAKVLIENAVEQVAGR